MTVFRCSAHARTVLAATLTLCFATFAKAATVELYLSAPGVQAVQGAYVSNPSSETFDTLPTASIGTSGAWAVGTYTATNGSVAVANQYGGAGGTGKFLNVSSAPAAPISVVLQGNRRYVGFWWSAGDANNAIRFYDAAGNLLVSFTTASLTAILTGAGNITSIDGTSYAKSAYYGNPNPPAGRVTNEPFGFINLLIKGTTTSFSRIEISGTSFELDNTSIADDGTADPKSVNYGSQTIAVPPGEIGVNNDTFATALNTPVSGNAASNDTGPVGTTRSVDSLPSNGNVVFNPDGTFTYTPAKGFSGSDSFSYRACKPAPDQTQCDVATVNLAVGIKAIDDSASTRPGVATVGTTVAGNDSAPAGSSYSPVTGPANGTLSMDGTTGAYVYTPANGFLGTDTFTYRVCLPSPNTTVCDTAKVSINVAPNVVPVASSVAITAPLRVGVAASGSYAYSDNENDAQATSTFRWVRSATALVGDGANVGTSASYTPTAADVGQNLFFCVTPIAASGASPGAEVCTSAGPAAVVAPFAANVNSIPTLSEWALIVLSAMLGLIAWGTASRRNNGH